MDKTILNDYVDACEIVRETERDIKKLRRRMETIHTGSVKGSLPDFPYTEAHFRVEGSAYTYDNDRKLRAEEKLLEERRAKAEDIKRQVEQWMTGIPLRMQRIIRYKFFDRESWEQTAVRIGKKSTGDSIRKEFDRFMDTQNEKK